MSLDFHINSHFHSYILDKQFSGPCIIIGSGPSSGQLAKFPQWKEYYSISCNFSQIYFPSQIYSWQDKDFILREKRILSERKYLGMSILPTSEDYVKDSKLMSGLGGFLVNRKKSGDSPSWLTDKNSYKVQSCSPITGVISICMAYIMGFSPIVLVGFDATEGNYAYYRPHFRWRHFNFRGAKIHSLSQAKFLKRYATAMNVINCSYSPFAKQEKIGDVLKKMGSGNFTSNCKIAEDIYIDNLKKINSPFLSIFSKKATVKR